MEHDLTAHLLSESGAEFINGFSVRVLMRAWSYHRGCMDSQVSDAILVIPVPGPDEALAHMWCRDSFVSGGMLVSPASWPDGARESCVVQQVRLASFAILG